MEAIIKVDIWMCTMSQTTFPLDSMSPTAEGIRFQHALAQCDILFIAGRLKAIDPRTIFSLFY